MAKGDGGVVFDAGAGTHRVDGASESAEDASTLRVLRGRLTYDFVPQGAEGLKYDEVEVRPVRGAKIRALRAADDRVISETTTDEDGRYSLPVEGINTVRVFFSAEREDPPIRVEDNTWDDLVWSGVSEEIDLSTFDEALNLHASSGWDGDSYSKRRLAAPFAILDTLYKAARTLRADQTAALEPLVVNWSPKNIPEFGDLATGRIGATRWSPQTREMFVLGAADVNTDEFDRHVLVHEWAHYLEQTTARLDSIGGAHQPADSLDARVAFSEGWANAVSAAVLAPDTVYRDSAGEGQAATRLQFDVENVSEPVPGWYSEATCHGLIHDLIDPANEAWDDLHLGLAVAHDALMGSHSATEGFTTIFSFLSSLFELDPTTRDPVARLTEERSFGPVVDEFGTGETADGGWASNLPVYRQLIVGGEAVDLQIATDVQAKGVERSRYLLFTAPANEVVLAVATAGPVDIGVYERGKELATASVDAGQTISVTTEPGRRYAVSVRATAPWISEFVCTIEAVEG